MRQRLFFISLVLIIFSIASGLGLRYALAVVWTEPMALPPGGNVPAPINVGAGAQIKTGDLTIGGNFSVSSGEVVGVPTGGNMGVGALNAEKLCIQGDCRGNWPEAVNAFVDEGNVGFGPTAVLGTNDNVPLSLETNGVSRMMIGAAGNVGIGTTNTAFNLMVGGVAPRIYLLPAPGSNPELDFGSPAMDTHWAIYRDMSSDQLRFWSWDAGNVISIQNNGSVGIRKTDPLFALDVVSSTEAITGRFSNSFDAGIGLYTEGSGTGGKGVDAIATGTGVNYGVFGRTMSDSGWAGYFIGGKGVYTPQLCLGSESNCRTSWPGATVPGGMDSMVQFNDGGNFGGSIGLTYNKANSGLNVGGPLLVGGTIGVNGLGASSTIGIQARGSDAGGYFASSSSSGYAMLGQGDRGVYGYGNSAGLYGLGGAYGIYGSGTNFGVYGSSNDTGVYGSGSIHGVYGMTTFAAADAGYFENTATTAYARLGYSTWAGQFGGNVNITGNLVVDTNTLVVDASNNRVGIGKETPSYTLDILSPSTIAIYSKSTAAGGRGIVAEANNSSGAGIGGGFWTAGTGTGATGVYGEASGASGTIYGVRGITNSPSGWGGYFTGGKGVFTNQLCLGTESNCKTDWPSSGGTPGGLNTYVQFNDNGVFGGDSGLTYQKATGALSVGGNLSVGVPGIFYVDVDSSRVAVGSTSLADASLNVLGSSWGKAIYASTTSTGGIGIYSIASATGAVSNIGGNFQANGNFGTGVTGIATATGTVSNIGGAFSAAGQSGKGVIGSATSTTGINYGVYGETLSSSGWAGFFTGGQGVYVNGDLRASRIGVGTSPMGGYGVTAQGSSGGVYGESSGGYGVQGVGSSAGGYFSDREGTAYTYIGYGSFGVYATGSNTGVYATGSPIGVYGSGSNMGGSFYDSDGTSSALLAYGGYGGDFTGDVRWSGTLQGGSVPWARLTSFPAVCPSGQFVVGVNETLICAAGGTGTIGGSGTTNYVAKFTGASTISNSVITDNGTNVGIGDSTNPLAKLVTYGNVQSPAIPNVNTNSFGILRIRGSIDALDIGVLSVGPYSAWLQAGYSGTTTNPISLNPLGGNVGIGTTSPGIYKLNINGSGYLGAAAWVYSSDRRLKENISYLGTGLDIIEKLKPAEFDFINGEKNQVGFIAQDVQEVLSNIVEEGADGMLGIKTESIVPYLVKSVQEQQEQINVLKAIICQDHPDEDFCKPK